METMSIVALIDLVDMTLRFVLLCGTVAELIARFMRNKWH